MAKRPEPSKAEMGVAKVLWRLGEATAREVCEALPESEKRDFSTIQTYLARLESKGYVTSKLHGRVKLFTSKVKGTQVIRETVNDLVNRLFAGESLSLVKHLIDEGHVTGSELDQLKGLLEAIETDEKQQPKK